MNRDVLCFFDKSPLAIPLYEALKQRVLSEIGDFTVRKAKERPKSYIVITFGLIMFSYLKSEG